MRSQRVEGKTFSGTLDELCWAMMRLDHDAVERCSKALEDLLHAGAMEVADPAEMANLRARLRYASRLAGGASEMYGQWARIAAIESAGYTAEGEEPRAEVRGSLKVTG
jgi:hypothetical protein